MTTFEEDMKLMTKQVTAEVIFHINKTPQLYKDVVKARNEVDQDVAEDNVAQVCYDYAEANNNEFGSVFQAELDAVDWSKVIRGV